jgi:predicted transcriptional regulator of viral defense system
MKTRTQPIDVSILGSMRSSRGDSVFSPRDFDGVGSPDAARQALSRLVKAGKIRRIRRGLYDLPRSHPITGQIAPNIMATVRAWMDGSHAQWQFTGACAANTLGVSDQIPSKKYFRKRGERKHTGTSCKTDSLFRKREA